MLERLDRNLTPKKTRIIVGAIIAAALVFGLFNSFIQDDAFISFRYAENFVKTGNLSWNPNSPEPVEGYTNFLWTLLISAAIYLGISPVPASLVLGFISGFATLFFTYRLSLLILGSERYALLTTTLMGFNFTFSSYITGGLETQLQTFLITASFYIAFYLVKRKSILNRFYLASLSLLFSISLLTRMDSALPVVVLYLFISYFLFKNNVSPKGKAVSIFYLTFPSLIIVGTWFVWKYYYYGDIFPNSYYAKATDLNIEILISGVYYIYAFLHSYLLIPFVFLGFFFLNKLFKNKFLLTTTIVTSLWFIYVIKVGGDFMEFRFIVPIMPLIFITLVAIIQFSGNTKIRYALSFLVLIGSIHHYLTFDTTRGIETISQLYGHINNNNENWDTIGKVFKTLFAEGKPPVKIATTAAGAIPYYSQLPTIDMHGINDKWIARNFPVIKPRPGHQKQADLDYLIHQKVNLVIGHPQLRKRNELITENYHLSDLENFRVLDLRLEQLPKNSKIIEIPVSKNYKVIVLYLTKHKYVDEVIRENNLRITDLVY